MKVNKSILVLAVLFGLLSVFALSYYLNGQRQKLSGPVNYQEIIVAANTIPANVKITAAMLTTQKVPADLVHPDAVTSIAPLIDGITTAEIIKGEPVLTSRVMTETSDADMASLSYQIPENMRAIAIPISEITGIAGYIVAGDQVDLLVAYEKKESEVAAESTPAASAAAARDPAAVKQPAAAADSKPADDAALINDSAGSLASAVLINSSTIVVTQLQDLTVLAVGSAAQNLEENFELPSTLTLLVNPDQAEVLVFALNVGTVHLVMRNPADATVNQLSNFNSANFASYQTR